ncbi:MAG: tRNA pseudouridine(55) synthase TruB [Candidatus Peribacteraceae bacterium]|nr:tRNA pseudouridine(55) synthase TruB [Candidatus Peribacteraceae bacterium]
MDGFLAINKPKGITSHDAVAFARRRLKIRKIGHAGTLDPMATGVLILGIGAATRLLEYVQQSEKEYEAELTFGSTSSTDDADGELTPFPESKKFARPELEKVLPEFIGVIHQIPPQFSAIKIAGQSAHRLARSGQKVKLKSREVEIHEIKIRNFDFPRTEISVRCGSGTYIRSLARDLGARLESGAYLSKLTRTRVGDFTLNRALPLRSIRAEKILPIEAGITFPQIRLTRIEADKVQNGQKIPARTSDPYVAAFFENHFLAILAREEAKHSLKPEKVFARNLPAEKLIEFATHKIR